jgi:hypothetical protein
MNTKSKPAVPVTPHSPLPWRCEVRTADDPAAIPDDGEDGAINDYFVMDCHGHDIVSLYDRADAALICRAVNSHAALVQALKAAVVDMEHADDVPGIRIRCGSQCSKCQAQAALNLAWEQGDA